MSAWIEIVVVEVPADIAKVALYMSAWIEVGRVYMHGVVLYQSHSTPFHENAAAQ